MLHCTTVLELGCSVQGTHSISYCYLSALSIQVFLMPGFIDRKILLLNVFLPEGFITGFLLRVSMLGTSIFISRSDRFSFFSRVCH